MGMRRNLIASLALGLILGFAPLHEVQAGERKFAVMSGARSNFQPAVARLHGNATGEYSFSPVSPLASRSAVRSQGEYGNARPSGNAAAGAAKETGPTTAPSQRKAVTFFRLDPKFGDVSVQPVVGGVNGAQLAVGF